ncbi:MAG: hypothetical protein ACKOEE_17315 [Tagaea sp.]
MTDPHFIRVKDVAKTYVTGATDVEAVAHVDFDVAEGEFVSILGPSGCGQDHLGDAVEVDDDLPGQEHRQCRQDRQTDMLEDGERLGLARARDAFGFAGADRVGGRTRLGQRRVGHAAVFPARP